MYVFYILLLAALLLCLILLAASLMKIRRAAEKQSKTVLKYNDEHTEDKIRGLASKRLRDALEEQYFENDTINQISLKTKSKKI